MTTVLQWAKANLPARGKDEDAVFIHSLPGDGGLLLGVADGISTANGRHAARWIAQTMSELAREVDSGSWDVRQLFDRFVRRLADAAAASQLDDSHSTLSCGIARTRQSGGIPILRFEFFGIGDSPIWRVVQPLTSALEFQAVVAYGPPVPSEIAGLYSWVNLGQGRIQGQVHFGSVDIQGGELLIVSSDGVPESQVLMDDQDLEANSDSPRLINRLLHAADIDDSMLRQILTDYDDRHLLIDDDASLAVVRLTTSTGVVSAVQTDADVAEPATEQVRKRGLANEAPQSVPTTPHFGDEPTIQAELPLEQSKRAQKRKRSESGTPKAAYSKKLTKAQRKKLTEKKIAASALPKATGVKVRKKPLVKSESAKK